MSARRDDQPDEDVPPFHLGNHATASCCLAPISRCPPVASSTRASSSSRLKGTRSAVACTSIEPAVSGHDDIHVHVGCRVLDIVEVEARLAVDDPHGDRADEVGRLGQPRLAGRQGRGRPRRPRSPLCGCLRPPGSRHSRSRPCARRASPGRTPPARSGRAAAGSRRFDPSVCPRSPPAAFAGRSEAGSIPYSAVSQPRPLPASQRGTPSSTLAVQRTRVPPNEMSAEPVACSTKPVTISTGRSSSVRRPSRLISTRFRHTPRATRADFACTLGSGWWAGVPRTSNGGREGHAEASSSSRTVTRSTWGMGSWRKRSPSVSELLGRPGREKARLAGPGWIVLDPLSGQRLGHFAGGLVGREDERRPAAEGSLEHPPDHRVVRTAEDDRVDVLLLERRRVLAHRRVELLPDDAGLDQRHEPRARDRDDPRAGVERMHDLLVAAARHGRLGREQADPPVPRRLHGRVRLGDEHADDRHPQRLLQRRQRRRGGRVAGRDDQLYPLLLEIRRNLEGKAPDLTVRPRPVRTAGAVSQIEEVLVRKRDEALVQDGEPAGARIEDPDRPSVHPLDSRRAGGRHLREVISR